MNKRMLDERVITVPSTRSGFPAISVGGSACPLKKRAHARLMLSGKFNRKKHINFHRNPTAKNQAIVVGKIGDYYKEIDTNYRSIRTELNKPWEQITDIEFDEVSGLCSVTLKTVEEKVIYSEEFFQGMRTVNYRDGLLFVADLSYNNKKGSRREKRSNI